MHRATDVIQPADMDEGAATVGAVTLMRDARYRRRIVMATDGGVDFLLDLPEATYLPHGAGLKLDTGEIIRVIAAEEPLLEICAPTHEALLKIAWHIGNRHTPAEVTASAIYIQPDHVLAEMAAGLGGTVADVRRAFEPEGGAYGHHGSLHASHHHHHHGHGDGAASHDHHHHDD